MFSWGGVFWAHLLFPGGRVGVSVVCAYLEEVSDLFSANSARENVRAAFGNP